jgi:hypothetical protein
MHSKTFLPRLSERALVCAILSESFSDNSRDTHIYTVGVRRLVATIPVRAA